MNTYKIGCISGSCPTQAYGVLADGREFYFRARHGVWSLQVAAHPGNLDFLSSPCIAEGLDDTYGDMMPSAVMKILDKHLPDQMNDPAALASRRLN